MASSCDLTGATYGVLGVIGPDGSFAERIELNARSSTGRPRPDLVELPIGRGSLAAAGHYLGVEVTIRGTVFAHLLLADKVADGAFTAEDETLVLALAGAAGFVVENARAYALSERQRSWLEASSRLDETLQGPMEFHAVLPHIAVGTRVVSGAVAVGLFRLDLDGTPVMVAADGREVKRLAATAPVVERELAAALQGEQPIDLRVGADRWALFLPVRTQLVPPLVLLVLVEAARDATRQPLQERGLTMAFADHAARALDRLQALTDRQQLAQVTDRDRIARDLHDLVIQRLFATGLQLQGIRAKAEGPGVRERIDQTVLDLDSTVRDIRSTIFGLQDHDEEYRSLRHLTHGLVAEYRSVLGYLPDLRITGPVDTVVDAVTRDHALAVLREGLSNVAQHARSTSTRLEIEVDPTQLVIRLTDDGQGFPDERNESGLRNVRFRAQQLGGAVRLVCGEPHGTVLEWKVPLGG